MSLFKLRGDLNPSQSLGLGVGGVIFILLLWWGLAEVFSTDFKIVKDYHTELPSEFGPDSLRAAAVRDSLIKIDSINYANSTNFEKRYTALPLPTQVVAAFPDLIKEDGLAINAWRSIWLNIQGYFWAIVLSLPFGFMIGLLPIFKGLFSKPVDALRYLPLAALIGLFMSWFGSGDTLKIAFLSFGILVYLLPVVAQRIGEVKEVYIRTVFTLNATDWQTIKSVYLPSVLSKLIDDIRVLTAISWTYIIFIEFINKEGGLGALIHTKRRLGQVPEMFAILLVIVGIGFLQDRIFVYLDKRLFPHKYHKTILPGINEVKYGIFAILGITTLAILQSVFLPNLSSTMSSIALVTLLASVVFIFLGEFKVRKAIVD